MKKMDDRSRALAAENYQFAIYMANKFTWTGIEKIELISICNFALCKAARDFDESLGYKFSTFAARAMHNEVLMSLQGNKQWKQEKASGKHLSLDYSFGYDDSENLSLADAVGKIDPAFELVDAIECFSLMNRRDLQMRMLYHVYGYNQPELSEIFGFTQAHISRIIRKPVRMKEAVR